MEKHEQKFAALPLKVKQQNHEWIQQIFRGGRGKNQKCLSGNVRSLKALKRYALIHKIKNLLQT